LITYKLFIKIIKNNNYLFIIKYKRNKNMVKKLNLLIFISFIIFCNTKPSDEI